jgi:hypothetical protein
MTHLARFRWISATALVIGMLLAMAAAPALAHREDVPLDVELGDGGSVSELSQVGEAATWGVAVGMVVWVGVVGASAARFAATSRSTATASLARSG